MGFFKAVAVAWPSLYNELENKFYPGSLSFLGKCNKNKTKLIIFSAHQENDPQPEIKKILKENKITITNTSWPQSETEDEIKTEVLNSSSFDPTRTFNDLSENELFYCENRNKLVEMIEKNQNSEKVKRALIGAAIILVPILLLAGGVTVSYITSVAAAKIISFIAMQIIDKITLPWAIVIGVGSTIFTTLISALIGSMTVKNDLATIEEAKQPLLGNTNNQVKKELQKENKNNIALTNSDKRRLSVIDNDKEADEKVVRPKTSGSGKTPKAQPLMPATTPSLRK